MRTYEDAVARARQEVSSPSQGWGNLCQMLSRTCVGAAAWAPSARQAFWAIPEAHRHTEYPPPAGSIAYWGANEPGHATFVVNSTTFISNDVYRRGRADFVHMSPSRYGNPFWGLDYLGWIDSTPSGLIDVRKRGGGGRGAGAPVPEPGVPAGGPRHAKPVPPFHGDITGGMRGPAVDFVAWCTGSGRPPGAGYAQPTIDRVKRFQRLRPLGRRDGVVDRRTYDALARKYGGA